MIAVLRKEAWSVRRSPICTRLRAFRMNRMLKGWRQTKRGEQFRARIVNYADDSVILSRGHAEEALSWTRGVLERLELTLNEKKTSLRNAHREQFDFLGYTFGPHYSMRTGKRYMGYSPSKKSVARIKAKVGDYLKGWRAYFAYGAT